jgi:hypothetical protein
MRTFIAVLALCVTVPVIACTQAWTQAWAQTPTPTSWQDAVARLAEARSKAETCVALLKKHGNGGQVSRGNLTYTNAKAQVDSVIAGLTVALADGGEPDSLPSLQGKLGSGASQLAEFCDGVTKILPPAPTGQKSEAADLAKAVLEALAKPLSDAVAAIYNNYRSDQSLVRATIKTQLEAARWPDFAQVKAAQ